MTEVRTIQFICRFPSYDSIDQIIRKGIQLRDANVVKTMDFRSDLFGYQNLRIFI